LVVLILLFCCCDVVVVAVVGKEQTVTLGGDKSPIVLIVENLKYKKYKLRI